MHVLHGSRYSFFCLKVLCKKWEHLPLNSWGGAYGVSFYNHQGQSPDPHSACSWTRHHMRHNLGSSVSGGLLRKKVFYSAFHLDICLVPFFFSFLTLSLFHLRPSDKLCCNVATSVTATTWSPAMLFKQYSIVISRTRTSSSSFNQG